MSSRESIQKEAMNPVLTITVQQTIMVCFVLLCIPGA